MLVDDKLREEGIHLRDCRVGDHKTTCPNCSEHRRHSDDPCLSVTVESEESAVWKCHHCGWAAQVGGERKRDDFTTKERPTTRSVKNEPPKPPKPPAKPKPSSSSDDRDALLAFFEARGISEATLDHFGIFAANRWFRKYEREVPSIVIPYIEDGQVVNHKYRPIKEKGFGQDGGTKRTLFNIDGVKAHWQANPDAPKEVVFVEGEMDVLALYEAGVTHATTLPDGASKTIKIGGDDKRFAALRNCPWIGDAERVLLAGDNDEAGLTLRAELVRRFGAPVCWTVEWPEGCKDANEALLQTPSYPQTLMNYLEDATPMPIDGLHGVSEYRDQVLELYHGDYAKPFSTGFSHLDEIYKVMPGTFNVVTGIPSHGKSNFIDQLAVNLMRSEEWRFAVFSPEHSTANHIRRLVEKVVEKPFDPGPNPRMLENELNDAMDTLEGNFHFIEAEDRVPDIDWILERIKGAVLRHGVRGAIIDPYNEICSRRDVGKREDEHVRDLISSCKVLCRNHGLTIWMVAHPTKLQRETNGKYPVPTLYDIAGAAHWNNMADAGLVVHRDFEKHTTEVFTRKIREQGVYGQVGSAAFRFSLVRRCYVKDSDFEEIDGMPSSGSATTTGDDDEDTDCPF